MRYLMLILFVTSMCTPLFSHEEHHHYHQHHHQHHHDDDCDHEVASDEYVTEDDFLVGKRMYRWYILPSGKRILKCRRIHFNVTWGVSFGPWRISSNFHCSDYHDDHFTYCPHCRIYYCNHHHHGPHRCFHFKFHKHHHRYHVHHYWRYHRPWRPWVVISSSCSWHHGPHGWSWYHGKHCWHWRHGKHGKKYYYTKHWKHHGPRPYKSFHVHKHGKSGHYVNKAKPHKKFHTNTLHKANHVYRKNKNVHKAPPQGKKPLFNHAYPENKSPNSGFITKKKSEGNSYIKKQPNNGNSFHRVNHSHLKTSPHKQNEKKSKVIQYKKKKYTKIRKKN